MLIKQATDIRSSEVTSESDHSNRRTFLAQLTALGTIGAASGTFSSSAHGLATSTEGTTAALSNVVESPLSTRDEELTSYEDVTSYNNFYEFGTGKSDPRKNAQKFNPSPWSLEVSGECAKPGTIALEDLISPHQLEERIYRFRCVEAWSMVIPWVGVSLAEVLKRFEPTSKAKYVAFQTLHDPKRMPAQRIPIMDWPYVEGLRIDEAMHPLSMLVVGLYGRVLPNQNGAPLRLMVPWKYGFKSIKSIVRISFAEQQPPTSWNIMLPAEYGFYSNVNPKVSHPRWSQAKERRIGNFFKQKTLMFNGYAEQVASLYQGMDLKKNF